MFILSGFRVKCLKKHLQTEKERLSGLIVACNHTCEAVERRMQRNYIKGQNTLPPHPLPRFPLSYFLQFHTEPKNTGAGMPQVHWPWKKTRSYSRKKSWERQGSDFRATDKLQIYTIPAWGPNITPQMWCRPGLAQKTLNSMMRLAAAADPHSVSQQRDHLLAGTWNVWFKEGLLF